MIANELAFLGTFSGADMLYTYPNGDEAYIIGISFVCEDFSGEVLQQTDEALELRWFEPGDLPEDTLPSTKRELRALLGYMRLKG